MRARTEEEIIAKAPIEATFGDKKYLIKPLTILKQRTWRKKLNDELGVIIESFNKPAGSQAMRDGLTSALLQFPEKIEEMVFSYDPDLPREEILEIATEEQLASAFSQIMTVAYPYLAQLGTVTQIVKSSLSRIQ